MGAVFRFGSYELDEGRRELRRNGTRVELQATPFSVLLCLVRNAGRTVTHDEFARELWSDVRVGAGSLRTAVTVVRKALARAATGRRSKRERAQDGHEIRCERGVGYRFVGVVDTLSGGAERARPTPRTGLFVDREPEMEQLRAATRAALADERQVVLVEGPAGIGKTRLMAEVAREAASLDFEIHVGRAHEGQGARPGWPWIQSLRGWLDTRGADALGKLSLPGGTERLEAFLEVGAAEASNASAPTRDETDRFRLLLQITRFLEQAARRRPLLLVLDDLHADPLSLEILAFVAQMLQRTRLVIVAAHRPLEASRARVGVLREAGTRSLSLGGIGLESIRLLLASALGSEPSPALAESILGASAGNPFFVTELARAAASNPHAAPAASASVHAVVWSRVADCSPSCRRVLETACLIGTELTLARLRATGLERRELVQALDEACRRDLLVATPQGHRFVHGIVRESLLDRLGPVERMELHLRLGEDLERHAEGDPARHVAELAYHFIACAPLVPERATRLARRAAESARNTFAYAEAAELYRQALAALELSERPDASLRGELLLQRAEMLVHAAAAMPAFHATFVEAIELGRATGRARLVARAAERCVVSLFKGGHLTQMLGPSLEIRSGFLRSALDEVRSAPEVSGDAILLAQVLLASAMLASSSNDLDQALALSSEIRAILATPEASGSSAETLAFLAVLDSQCERPDRFRVEPGCWPRTQLGAHSEYVLCTVDCAEALERGDRALYDAGSHRIVRLADETAIPAVRHMAQRTLAVTAQIDGPLDAVRRHLLESNRAAQQANVAPEWIDAVELGCSHWLALLDGSAAELARRLDVYLARQAVPAQVRILLGRLHAEVGQHERARRELESYLVARRPRITSSLLLGGIAAETCVILGDRDAAQRLWTELRPSAHRLILVAMLLCHGLLARPLGSLAALLGRWDEASALFESSARHAAALRAPLLSVLTSADHALAFQRHPKASEREQARALLHTALREARALDLRGLVSRLESRADHALHAS